MQRKIKQIMEIWKKIIEEMLVRQSNKVVSMDLEKGTINYSDKLVKYEDPKVLKGSEEVTRAFLINRLVNELDYKPELIEIEKRYSIGRPKTSKAEIDVIVRDNDGNAFFYIEAKAPEKFETDKKLIKDQLFALAKQEKNVKYLVYYTCDLQDEKIIDKAIIIDYQKFSDFDDWENAGSPSTGNELSPGYNKPKKQLKIKGDPNYDLETKINRESINSLSTNLHNVLWGGGGTSDTEIFYSLVNIILAKIQDESEKEDGEEYDFQIHAYGDNIENPEKLFERINGLYRRALKEKLNIEDLKRIEKSYVIHEEKFPLNKLVYTVQTLENYSFIEGRSSLDGRDILGDFFERIIRDGFKQNKGQFFTPAPIVKFLIYALKLDELAINKLNNELELPYIIDPSVGAGTFLIEAMKLITKEVKYKQKSKVKTSYQVKERFDDFFMPDHKENRWAEKFLYGIDINFDLGTASKVNMILHGDGASNIFVKDGLLPFRFFSKEKTPSALQISLEDELYEGKEVNEEFDVVIGNPPFSVDLDKETKRYLDKGYLFGDKKNSENLFIERWYQILKEKGRLGVVLPESVFDTSENKYIRLFLYKYFDIKAVISLPQITFEPYTSTKTSLLFAQKKTKSEIIEWNNKWKKYGEEWTSLKTRVNNYIKVFLEGKDIGKYPSIKEHTEDEIKTNIIRYLKNYIGQEDEELTNLQLLTKYKEEIEETGKFDTDTKDVFGHYNVWWVFSEVSKYMDKPIFMAEAENVSYKRTKRGEKKMPNDLYDIEVAPTFIKPTEIIKPYDERINYYVSLIKELEEEKLIKTTEKQIKKLTDDIQGCKKEIELLNKQKEEMLHNIDKYYVKARKEYRIKEEYVERTDEELIEVFTKGVLANYSSEDVLIGRKQSIKILDAIRSEVDWE